MVWRFLVLKSVESGVGGVEGGECDTRFEVRGV